MTRFRSYTLLGHALVLFVVLSPSITSAQESTDKKPAVVAQDVAAKLIGTWTLEKAERPGSPSGIGTRLKMFTGTHWCVIQPDANGKIVFLHGGTYEFDGTNLTTTTDFAGDRTAQFIGNKGTVKLEIDGDTLRQIDPNGVFNETWRRVRKKDPK